MSSCTNTLNADIGGFGVRFSYYLQTWCLGYISVRSDSVTERAGTLYTLIATNMAMAVTGLISGLKPMPEITLQDAVIMIYLLSMGWITVVFCLGRSDEILQLVSVIHSYVTMIFIFAVLATAPRFGANPGCNHEAVAVLFRPFPALKIGRVLGWVITGLVFLCYTAATIRKYTACKRRIGKRHQIPRENNTPATIARELVATQPRVDTCQHYTPRFLIDFIDYYLVFMLFFLALVWSFFVLNIELIIRWYFSIAGSGDPDPLFGQMFPIFLLVLPVGNLLSVFRKYGIRQTKRVYRMTQVSETA